MFRNRRRTPRPDERGAELLAELANGYDALGANLQEVLPPGWSRAWTLAEMRRDTGMLVGAVTMGDSTVVEWPALPQETFAIFRRIYESSVTTGDAGGVWTAMTFDLDAGGHFDVGLGYEPRDTEGQEERVAAWAKAIEDSLR